MLREDLQQIEKEMADAMVWGSLYSSISTTTLKEWLNAIRGLIDESYREMEQD